MSASPPSSGNKVSNPDDENPNRRAGELCPDQAGLKYASDRQPGITRVRVKSGFRYVDPAGKRLTEDRVIARIHALAIPPAYEQVWICSDPNGYLQATGRDARGRKQYRYHEHWAAVRGENKYQQLYDFGCALPGIRRRVARNLAARTLCEERIIAAVVRLLDTTLIRVGSRAYARTNKSYGLTTLKRRHVTVTADRIRFQFNGKSGVRHDVTVTDARVARIVKRCMELPGHQLFHYADGQGMLRMVDSSMVNAYLKEAGHGEFTAKHYRTWAGSVVAFAALQRQPAQSDADARRIVVQVVKDVAQRLGNTPAICRSCYIHPAILEAYFNHALPQRQPMKGPRGLNADERRVLDFLRETGTP
jgi:DNA topoisomerase-1